MKDKKNANQIFPFLLSVASHKVNLGRGSEASQQSLNVLGRSIWGIHSSELRSFCINSKESFIKIKCSPSPQPFF